jgi:general secretion pathway protein N
MRRALLIVSGLVGLVVLGAALLPLGWVTGRYVPGLEADSVSGSIWDGEIRGARYAGQEIGDLKAGLAWQPLLRGEAEIGWTRLERQRGDRLAGRATLSRGVRRVSGVTGTVALPVKAGGLAGDLAGGMLLLVGLEDLTVVTDVRGRCRSVSGVVTATLAGLPVIGTTQPLTGQPVCEGEAFHAPMRLADETLELDLRLWPSGRWQADLAIRRQAELVTRLLEMAGFERTAGGVSIRFAGTAAGA